MNRLYRKDDIISLIEKLQKEETTNFDHYNALNAPDDMRRKINEGMLTAYYNVLHGLNNINGSNNAPGTIVIELTIDEILELSNGLINSMHNYDEAVHTCAGLPDAARIIENKRSEINKLNQKILSYC